jgi:hypothetical protein
MYTIYELGYQKRDKKYKFIIVMGKAAYPHVFMKMCSKSAIWAREPTFIDSTASPLLPSIDSCHHQSNSTTKGNINIL